MSVLHLQSQESIDQTGMKLEFFVFKTGIYALVRRVNLSGNCISKLDLRRCIFPKLESFRMCGNGMTSFKYSAKTFPVLETLDLSYNSLQAFWVKGLARLSILDLTGNSLATFELESHPTLRKLYLCSNSLSRITFIGEFHALKTLQLNKNNLVTFEIQAPSLRNLVLSKNRRLQSIDMDSTSLRKLYVCKTNIRFLKEDLLESTICEPYSDFRHEVCSQICALYHSKGVYDLVTNILPQPIAEEVVTEIAS